MVDRINTDTIVLYGKLPFSSQFPRADINFWRQAVAILDSVGNKVLEETAYLLAVRGYFWKRADIDRRFCLFDRRVEIVNHAPDY